MSPKTRTRLAAAAGITLALVTCTACRPRPFGPSREVLGDMNGVWRVIGGRQPWEITISASGQHIAIKRSVRDEEDPNRIYKRVDLDGKPGPKFSEIYDLVWSRDGSTLMYTAEGYRNNLGKFLVYGLTAYGPFDSAGSIVMSPDGRKWAAWVNPPGTKTEPRQLLVNGTIRNLPSPIDWDLVRRVVPSDQLFFFDETAQEFALATGRDQWLTLDGREAKPQLPPPSGKAPLPPGITIQTRIGQTKYMHERTELWRHELLLNGRSLGEFDHIFNDRWLDTANRNPADASLTGFPQPDGTVIFYVIKDNKVMRLRATPQQ